ncbi:uncharacterized protein Bfra_011023 [Botrytis fragariae]|uniref:Uncharacterized protein n=1 Tax=Botrytis fragariae TaxID=1964551 RepID=A0A8H6EF36_9HELO|nr:uncharacterized protein Bfra_011023 [Botrytis fragariae]KAF5869823.1 hypothetical protein Bfra_011023 [Botrytis fragariae]
MSYSSEAYNCCFNGNVLETCQYCGGSTRLPPCAPCEGTGISHRPCPYHSSSASYYSNNLQTVPAHRSREVRHSSGRSKNSHSGRTVK